MVLIDRRDWIQPTVAIFPHISDLKFRLLKENFSIGI